MTSNNNKNERSDDFGIFMTDFKLCEYEEECVLLDWLHGKPKWWLCPLRKTSHLFFYITQCIVNERAIGFIRFSPAQLKGRRIDLLKS